MYGGEGGIRTHGTVTGTPDFESVDLFKKIKGLEQIFSKTESANLTLSI